MGLILLTLLILVPIACYWVARRRFPKYLFGIVGAAFGVVVSPWALGLYSLYHVSPWGVVPGFIGLALTLIHGVPGFKLANLLGLIPAGVVSEFSSHLVVELLNGAFWAVVYGFVGLAIDRVRSRRLAH